MPFNVSKNLAKETAETKEIFGSPNNRFEIVKSHTAILGSVEQSVGVYQSNPSMREKVRVYYNDPLLQEGVVDFSNQVLSTGVFYSQNPEYKTKIAGKTPLQVIQQWADDNDIDLKLQEICTELKAFGNSYWRITNLGFVKIPIEAIWQAIKLDDEIALQHKYNLRTDPVYGAKILDWGTFIHFRINVTGQYAPFGIGMMDGMLARPVDRFGANCPSIYDIRLSMRGSLDEGFRKFSFGNVWIGVPDLSNEDFDNSNLGTTVANMKSTGNRIITNSDVKVALEVPQRTQSYDEFIKQMRNEFFMAVGDPQLKMGLEEGFTKATAESTIQMYKPRIAMMRLAIKMHMEDLFKQILEKYGFPNPAEAAVKMNFGPEETPEYALEDLAKFVQLKVVMPNECRKILVTYHKWELQGNVEDQPEYKEMKRVEEQQMQMAKTAKFPQPSKVAKEYTLMDIKEIFDKPIAKESEVDSKELELGIESELEHTSDREVAKRIALAHLKEMSDYYTKLAKMESS
jgi:hypothetical protein